MVSVQEFISGLERDDASESVSWDDLTEQQQENLVGCVPNDRLVAEVETRVTFDENNDDGIDPEELAIDLSDVLQQIFNKRLLESEMIADVIDESVTLDLCERHGITVLDCNWPEDLARLAATIAHSRDVSEQLRAQRDMRHLLASELRIENERVGNLL